MTIARGVKIVSTKPAHAVAAMMITAGTGAFTISSAAVAVDTSQHVLRT